MTLVFTCKVAHPIPVLARHTIRSDILNHFRRKYVSGMVEPCNLALKAMAICMQDIFRTIHPFKIISTIVCFHTIKMVDIRFLVLLFNKCPCNDTMSTIHFAI